MARSLADLANRLEKRARSIDEGFNQASVKAAITILSDLVFVTPVDTSKTLSNWQVSLNVPVDATIDAHFPGEKGSSRRASADAAIRAAKSVLASKKPGDTIYISNVTPNIARLNDGYSGQAPAGFVERAVLLGRREVRNAKIKV